MILSIVECGDYRELDNRSRVSRVAVTSSQIEHIKVWAPSVAQMRNRGYCESHGRWVLFKDEDCAVSSGDVLKTVKKIESEKPRCGAVGTTYQREKLGNRITQAYHFIQSQWVRRGVEPEYSRHLLGGALLVRREAMTSAGLFCENIGWGGEETEWTSRLIENGWQTEIENNWQVVHSQNLNFIGFFKRAWVQNYNRGYYQWHKHSAIPSRSGDYLRSPLSLLPWVCSFLLTGLFAYWAGRLRRKVEF